MKKIYNPKKEDWKDVLRRPTQTVEAIEGLVNDIFKQEIDWIK
jgi:histidinol dehydrogenase